MFLLLIIFSLFLKALSENYQKLSKHSSVKVIPNTKVYFDISSFNTGDLISFEIILDLFHGGGSRDSYTFQIDQVEANSYYDSNYWNNLRTVVNKNVSCDNFDDKCTFTWDEVKQEGKKYIYIIPPAPYDNFYTFWGNKIKIKHLGGELTAGAIVGIVFACIVFVTIIIVSISCCCCHLNPNCYTCCYKCCPSCLCCCNCCSCCCNYRRPYYPGAIGGNAVQVPVSQPVPVPVYPNVVAYPSSAGAIITQPVYPQPYPAPVYPTGY